MYLKNDIRAKFRFLHDVEASIGFTSTMTTQEFVGSTTIVPQVSLIDYTQLVSDPTLPNLKRYIQTGGVAAYEHTAMIRLHYSIARALETCVAKMESGMRMRQLKVKLHTRSGVKSSTPDSPDGVVVEVQQRLKNGDPYFVDSDDEDEEYESLWFGKCISGR
jgi:hypothetical protein